MRHDAFCRTVVLLAAHSEKDGAMGVILNRPLRKKLGQGNHALAAAGLGHLPLYEGGPVQEEKLLLAGWHWSAGGENFHLHFGLSKERVLDIAQSDPGIHLRGFLGHSGWGPKQLENELSNHAWVFAPMEAKLLEKVDGTELWLALLGKYHPELRLLAEAPDSPDFN